MFAILAVLLSADVELTLSVNSPTIRLCDPLIVKSAVKNVGRDIIAIRDRDPPCDNRVWYEYRVGAEEKWIPLPAMSRFAPFTGMPSGSSTDEAILWEKSVGTEYDVILLDDKDEFIFAKPGRFEIRALVETASEKRPTTATISQPVVVTVELRRPEDIERIKKIRGIIHKACGTRWQRQIPTELRELHDVGGSLGQNVKNLVLIERITSGTQKFDGDVTEFLGEHLSGLDWEIGLLRLGDYYRQTQDREHLAQILSALRYGTLLSSEWNYFMELKPRRGYDPSKYKPYGE